MKDNPTAAFALMIGSTFLLTIMDGSMKWLLTGYPVAQTLFLRTAIGLLPVAAYIAMTWKPGALSIGNPLVHLLRGTMALLAMASFFTAIQDMQLAEITAILMSAPLFIAFLSIIFLGEKVGWRRWCAVLVGFAGVLVTIQPAAAGVFNPVSLLAVAATFFYALMQVFTRRFAATETAPAMMIYLLVFIVLVTGCAAIPDWQTPDADDLPLIVFTGTIYGCGIITLTLAYRYAESSLIAPAEYLSIIWAAAIGVIVWGDIPASSTVAGAAIIAGSGIFLIRRNAKVT
jgi:drug/metabolite transporter (DMT)-like permease